MITLANMTNPIAITLDSLNSARAQNGKAPLKSWKESKAKLVEAIMKETLTSSANKTREQRQADAAALAEAEAKLPPMPMAAKAKGAVDIKALQEALAKTDKQPVKVPAVGVKPAKVEKVAAPKTPKAKASTGAGSSEAGIAAERLGVTAKALRAKLRKLGHTAGHGLSADQIVKLMKK
jgi:hypothetical protein